MTHVYTEEGVPQFHLSAAQAKKAGCWFSVTEHQKVLAKPALDQWLLGQHIKHSYNSPPRNGEGVDAYIRRIKSETRSSGGGAAKLGTKIHEALESVFRLEQAKQIAEAENKSVDDLLSPEPMKSLEDLDVDMRAYVAPALRWFESKQFKILGIEETLVLGEEAVGGTVDLAVLTPCGKKSVIDWKSRRNRGRKIISYPEQRAQVAAYAAAYFGPEAVKNKECWAANCFISTDSKTSDGEAEFAVITYKPDEVAHHYETFQMTCELWRRMNNYDPRKGKGCSE